MGSRKGIAKQQLMLLLLVFALIIVLMIFARDVVNGLGPATDRELCRSSVSAASYKYETPVIPITLFESPFNINCKTETVTLTDEVPLNKKTVKLREGNDGPNKNILKEFVLQKLSDCWYQFGQGKVKVRVEGDSDSACIICSQIFPGEDFIKKYGHLKLEGIYDYAENTERSKGMTYKTYLAGDHQLTRIFSGKITFNEQYYTIFKVAGKTEEEETQNGKGINFNRKLDGGSAGVSMVPASGIARINCKRLV